MLMHHPQHTALSHPCHLSEGPSHTYAIACETLALILTCGMETDMFHTAYKMLNVNIMTADNMQLGAWFIHSEPSYASTFYITELSMPPCSPALNGTIAMVIQLCLIIPPFHRNPGTCTVALWVTNMWCAWCLGMNVLMVDYRGLGDSDHMHPIHLFIPSYWLLYLELYEPFICLMNVCI